MEVSPILLLFSATVFFFFSCSAAVDTISANQRMKDGETIVSDGNMYELGFFTPGNSKNRYVGIWYKQISIFTVVWVANRETPINDTSGEFTVTKEGNLQIHSHGNTLIWSSNSTISVTTVSNPIAQLLDTGNLVVWDESSTKESPIWESFDYPGNTLLPGMKFGKDLITGRERYLTSWKTPDDPSIGLYKAWVDTRGYPQVFESQGQVDYSRLGPWNGIGYRGFPVENTNPIYSVEFVVNEKEVYYRYKLNTSSLQRMVVMSDGIQLRLNWYERSKEWVVYANIVVDSCSHYGQCGPYGSCNIKVYPPCSCMKGFEPKVPEEWEAGDWSSGCQRKTPLGCGTHDGFKKISGVKFPDTRRSWYNMSMSLSECEITCIMKCNCVAYANLDVRKGGSGCLLWFDELMDMRDYDDRQELYIRMEISELQGTYY